MVKAASIAGRVLYGALFVVAVPAVMIVWARATESIVRLPPVHGGAVGVALVSGGLLLLAAGARELIVRGRGLPMNAFPPPLLVQTGIIRWLKNPMYLGFVLASAGISIGAGSASGLWLVTPVASLAALALIYGFERPDLVRRFGSRALDRTLLSWPRAIDRRPTGYERTAVLAWVFIPWLISFFAVQSWGRPADAFGTALPFERAWPVWQWTDVFYDSAYVFVPLTPLLIRTSRALRRFALSGAVSTIVVTLFWVTVPVVAANRPFVPTGAIGHLLAFEQHTSAGVAAFPAFHVLWALIAASAWSDVGAPDRRIWPRTGWTWGLLITASCITTGMHTVVETAAAVLLFFPLRDPERTWSLLRAFTERIANSWQEWQMGPVRIINHAVYAGAAAACGFAIVAVLAGSNEFGAVVLVSCSIIAGAGLWAQALEGSSRLLRPFGWYGGMTGGIVGAVLAEFMLDAPVLPILVAFAVAAPWIQLIGRIRCLVQGCCHGGPAPAAIGIRYRHRRSRVTRIPALADVPIHPTPLYSMASNVVIGALLPRLRFLALSDTFMIGVYLILAGLARFVEEAYRAEPQTPIVAGLHSYQWLAIVSFAAGIACTMLPSAPPLPEIMSIDGRVATSALLMGALAAFTMGVDFPRSNRRFSRIAPAD